VLICADDSCDHTIYQHTRVRQRRNRELNAWVQNQAVKAAGIGPTDLALRAGYLKDAIPLPPNAVLGFEAAGTVDASGPA
jgi:lysine/ornithine N-monooxygenase